MSSQKENVVLKYINNQQFLNLKELSLFPDRAKVVISSSSLPSTRTGYAAAPFKCFLYSPQQSPSIRSPYPPLLFLFFLLFITVTVCILNLRLALAAFFYYYFYTVVFHTIPKWSPRCSVSLMVVLIHLVLSRLHLMGAAFEPGGDSLRRTPFCQYEV